MTAESRLERIRSLREANHRFTLVATAVWVVMTLLDAGYRLQWFAHQTTLRHIVDGFVLGSYVLGIALVPLSGPRTWRRLRVLWLDAIFVVLAFLLFASLHAATLAVFARRTPGGLRLLASTQWGRRYVTSLYRRPMAVLALSFALTILTGTMFLTFPSATENAAGAPFLTALFTATSATCVTGLVVVDTPTYFSGFGEVVILLLIEIGGLGIMTLSASLFVLMGRRLSARQRRLLSSVVDETSLRSTTTIVLNIFRATLAFEALGALILFLRWRDRFQSVGEAMYSSVFHAVSAFCNAGFSLFSDNLMGFVADPIVNFTFCALIVLGGIGFSVINDVFTTRPLWVSPARRWRHLQMHSKVVLVTSGLLIVLGGLAFFYAEFDHSLSALSSPVKLQAALFHVVSARTAGFNSVDMGILSPVGVIVMCVLMFVGGSPGGTAGGIKTTSFAALILAVRAILYGREDIEVFGRTISKENLYRAFAVGTISFVVVIVWFTLLVATQALGFIELLFECLSAFGTVGLSMNLTPKLNAAGQLLIVFLMFIGRVGPLSLALVASEVAERASYRYPEAKLLVG